jgi:hypothetical protein
MDLNIIKAMMAEQKYLEARSLIESVLATQSSDLQSKLYLLKFECLEHLGEEPKPRDVFSFITQTREWTEIHPWLEKIIFESSFDQHTDFLLLKMRWFEERGNLEELRRLISFFHVTNLENKRPVIENKVHETIAKYFRHDFGLKLQELATLLAIRDVRSAQAMVRELLQMTFERTTLKAKREKLEALTTILRTSFDGEIVLYRNMCSLYVHGIQDKKDYKALAELVIFFEDFSTQLLVLNLLVELDLEEQATEYAVMVKSNPEYDFLHITKFFPQLKSFFAPIRKKKETAFESWETPDLSLEGQAPDAEVEEMSVDESNHPELEGVVKFLDYSHNELCEIAVSMIQSELPKIALVAASRALAASSTDSLYLKAAYLKITCLMLLHDYRAAIDLAFEGMQKAKTQDDILSLMYAQAEAFMKLGESKSAKRVLQQILRIDSSYRLTRERLDQLNEV